ncbi:hypothetical protein K3495_g7780, partial [Podosphaera aphanis]
LKVNACAIRGNATLHDLPQPSQLEALISTVTSTITSTTASQELGSSAHVQQISSLDAPEAGVDSLCDGHVMRKDVMS